MFSPRTTLPSFTSTPTRMAVPARMCFSATSVGELKKTMESRSANSTSPTATPSTASAEPIRTRRLCLRVIARLSLGGRSAFEAEPFHEIVDLAQLVGLAGERAAGVADRRERLLAFAQYHIGAHQPQPSLDVRSVAIEPLRKARHHADDHGHALLRGHLGRRRHVVLARPRAYGAATDPRDLAPDEVGPGRIGGRAGQHGAPDFGSRRRLAVLFLGHAEEVAG